jgi:hypothetical protein
MKYYKEAKASVKWQYIIDCAQWIKYGILYRGMKWRAAEVIRVPQRDFALSYHLGGETSVRVIITAEVPLYKEIVCKYYILKNNAEQGDKYQ